MTDVVATETARSPRQVIEVMDAIPVLDTARFEHMQRIAAVMARSSLLPDSLTSFGKKDEKDRAAKSAGEGKFAPAAPPRLVVNNK